MNVVQEGEKVLTILEAGPGPGHARIWPNRIWPKPHLAKKNPNLAKKNFVTAFGQTEFGQN